MATARTDLMWATIGLAGPVRRAMRLALASGWFPIGAGEWESDSAVCPVVAAGKLAGYWRDRHLADGGPEWGSEDEPSPSIMEFAVAFDVYVGAVGVEPAVTLVIETLDVAAAARQVPA